MIGQRVYKGKSFLSRKKGVVSTLGKPDLCMKVPQGSLRLSSTQFLITYRINLNVNSFVSG